MIHKPQRDPKDREREREGEVNYGRTGATGSGDAAADGRFGARAGKGKRERKRNGTSTKLNADECWSVLLTTCLFVCPSVLLHHLRYHTHIQLFKSPETCWKQSWGDLNVYLDYLDNEMFQSKPVKSFKLPNCGPSKKN